MKRESIFILTSLMLIGLLGTASVSLGVGDTWTQKADMPTARYLSGSAVVDGKIYVIGGDWRFAGGRGVVTPAVEEYDPATDTWTTRADMPTARSGVVAAVDGMIYAIGGWDGVRGALSTDLLDTFVNPDVRKTDPETNSPKSANEDAWSSITFASRYESGNAIFLSAPGTLDVGPMRDNIPTFDHRIFSHIRIHKSVQEVTGQCIICKHKPPTLRK